VALHHTHIKDISKNKLKRTLNLFEVVCSGVGIIMGAGIYALIGVASAYSGNSLWFAFVLAAIIAALTGLSYAELSSVFKSDSSEYEYTKKYLPFDYQCARLDFLDKLDRAKKEATRGGRTEREIKIDFGDLDSYGNPKRFFLVKEDEDIEMRTIDNIKTPIIVSVSRQFRCSERGHKTTICIPRSIYEERKKK